MLNPNSGSRKPLRNTNNPSLPFKSRACGFFFQKPFQNARRFHDIVDWGDTLILYIRKTTELMIELVSDHGVDQYDMGLSRFFDLLLQGSLTNYASQRQVIAKIVHTSSKLPIVVDAQTILIPLSGIRSDHALFINLEAIAKLKKHGRAAIVTFRSGCVFSISSHASLLAGIAKVKRLKVWLNEWNIHQENAYIFEKGV